MGKKPKEKGCCNDCKFAVTGDKFLECHEGPPKPCSQGNAFQWKSPRVSADGWCGKHRRAYAGKEAE